MSGNTISSDLGNSRNQAEPEKRFAAVGRVGGKKGGEGLQDGGEGFRLPAVQVQGEYLLPSEEGICMATVEKISIALPADMVALVRDAVGSGEYASSSEVIRDALREWKYKRVLRQRAIDELRAAVQEGLNSGPGENLDIETIIERAKANRHAGHKG